MIDWFFLQATLERLEGIMQMPSQEEFVEMTSDRNGHYINGHGSVPGTSSSELFFVY